MPKFDYLILTLPSAPCQIWAQVAYELKPPQTSQVYLMANNMHHPAQLPSTVRHHFSSQPLQDTPPTATNVTDVITKLIGLSMGSLGCLLQRSIAQNQSDIRHDNSHGLQIMFEGQRICKNQICLYNNQPAYRNQSILILLSKKLPTKQMILRACVFNNRGIQSYLPP